MKQDPKKGGSIHVGKPAAKLVQEVTEKNAGKVELRIDYRTVILVDPERLKRYGDKYIINEFRETYENEK